jgi:hypothetical protein
MKMGGYVEATKFLVESRANLGSVAKLGVPEYDHSLMQATDFCHGAKAGQPIRDHFTSYCQCILCPVSDGGKGERGHGGKLHVTRVARIIDTDGRHDRHLVL